MRIVLTRPGLDGGEVGIKGSFQALDGGTNLLWSGGALVGQGTNATGLPPDQRNADLPTRCFRRRRPPCASTMDHG